MRLVQLKGNSLATQKFIRQLEILSGLRKLQEQTAKIIDSMTIHYDLTKDVRYLQGEKKGIVKGIEKGIEKGKLKQSIISIQNLLDKGFDIKMIADVVEVKLDFVASIDKHLKKKEEIITLLKNSNISPETIAKRLNVFPLLVEVLRDDLKNNAT